MGRWPFNCPSLFEHVEATDISAAQLDLAERRNNIRYSLQRAESTNFPDSHFDLITCAQAAHWFDIEAFNKEAQRVGLPGSVLAIWGYDLPRIDEKIDHLVDTFYHEIVGAYWNAERRHVDDHYERLNFEMSPLPPRDDLFTVTRWYREEFIGYLHSWSSVQNYRNANSGKDPIDWMIEEVSSQWDQLENKEVRDFQFFLSWAR